MGESNQSNYHSTLLNEQLIRRIAREECNSILVQHSKTQKTNYSPKINPLKAEVKQVRRKPSRESVQKTENQVEMVKPTQIPQKPVDNESNVKEDQIDRIIPKVYSNKLAEPLTHQFESYAEILHQNTVNRKVTFCDDNKEINLNATILKGESEFPITLLLDTGAQRSFISQHFFDRHLSHHIEKKKNFIRMYGVGGNELATTGEVQIDVQIGEEIIRQNFILADIKEQGILGFDFCQNHQAEWRWKEKEITLNTSHYNRLITDSKISRISLRDNVDIPARSEIIVSGILSHASEVHTTGMVEAQQSFSERYNVGVAAIVTEKQENSVPLRLMNVTEEIIHIRKNTPVAQFIPAEVVERESCRRTHDQETVETPEDFLKKFEGQLDVLDEQEKKQFQNLLLEYRGQFIQPGFPLGQTNLVKHEIHTGSHAPIKQRPRREPIGMQGVVQEELNKMLEKKIVEPSTSAWGSPIVLVRKKDNSVRFCIDYRKLNDITTKDAYPLPRIEDNLDALQGSKLFTTLDLASGYWQVQMAEEDKPKTAFSTKYGLYQFNVMPFGLCNAPGTFERLMETVLRGMQWERAVLYLDDIIIFSRDVQEHMERLKEIFQRLKTANLTLKPTKCKFFQKQVEFLGHVVDEEGIHTDPKKVEAVSKWETPTRVKDVRSFLGLTGYYRRFIRDYGKIAKPLHCLTEKEQGFHWTEETQKSFDDLKRALTSSPVLGYPSRRTEDLFILDTDASNCHIGGVLSQLQDGKETVIAYGSKVLSSAERNYCVTRRELLAVVHFCTQFKHYLIGRKFDLRTDHGALTWLFQFKQPEGQIARWLELLSQFQMNIIHRPGRIHSNGDGLSRKPCTLECPTCKKGEKLIQDIRVCQEKKKCNHRGRTARKRLRRIKQNDPMKWLKEAQQKDVDLQEISSWKQRPEWVEVKEKNRNIKTYWSRWDQLRFEDGLWQFQWKRGEKVEWKWIVPSHETQQILEDYHSDKLAGHFSFTKTIDAIYRSPYYIPMLRRKLSKFLKQCDICERTKPSTRNAKAPMKKCASDRPMQRIAIDVLGPLPETTKGNKFIIVVADYFTKWTEAYPVPNHQAETIAHTIVTEFFNRFGLPETIHTDQGRDFESRLFQEMCVILEIQKTRTTPWHPQSDGMVERFNRTIETLLRQCVDTNQKNWDEKLSFCCAAYRSALHSTTLFTPNKLMMGRDVPMPSHLQSPLPEKWETINEYNDKLIENMHTAHELTRQNTKKSVHQYKEQYNKKTWQQDIQVGTWVWLNNFTRRNGISPKLQVKWELEPYVVKKFCSEVVVEIQKYRSSKRRVVHLNKIKRVGDQNKWSDAGTVRRDPNARPPIARRTSR